MAVSPSGNEIATAGGDGGKSMVRIWNTATGKLQRQWRDDHPQSVRELVFSPGGQWLASADHHGPDDSSIRLWDVRTGRQLAFSQSANPTGTLAFSPDGHRLSFPSFSKIVMLEVPSLRKLDETIAGDAVEDVSGVAFTRDGRTLVGSGHTYGTFFLWDAATLDVIDWPARVPGRTFASRSGAFHPLTPPTISGDGRKLAAAGTYVWSLPVR
ncbi:WD40 repeat domain-containing protein [Krasilnikovia sp. MM14-A1259]|uniref:WD40 repeat domain-containing protein n=1 Tax=Krasilnikovia sp. MM14-A1259 TaxID=3373539 RepID=UPI00399D4626